MDTGTGLVLEGELTGVRVSPKCITFLFVNQQFLQYLFIMYVNYMVVGMKEVNS